MTIQTLPDIKEFITNKSDRFFVDFEDIIAGHPYVGKRSPRPHFKFIFSVLKIQIQDGENTKPSDFPPIYAVKMQLSLHKEMGHIITLWTIQTQTLPGGTLLTYSGLKFAQNNGNVVSFKYQMEGM